MTSFATRAVCPLALSTSTLLLACGGAVDATGDGTFGPGAPSPETNAGDPTLPEDDPSEPSSGDPSSGTSPACAGDTLDLVVTLEMPHGEYGRNGSAFQLSPTGRELLTFNGQYDDGTRLLNLETREQTLLPRLVFERDRAWELELAAMAYGAASLIFVDDPAADVLCERTFGARFSRDGTQVLDARCDGEHVILRHTAVDAPDDPREVTTTATCDTTGGVPAFFLAGDDVGFSVDHALHAQTASGTVSLDLHHAEWWPAASFPRPLTSDPFAAAPGGRHLAVADEADFNDPSRTITVVRYPSLDVVVDAAPVAWTYAYTDMYASAYRGMPLVWSPDGSHLVHPDENGDLVVRRVCDGAVSARLSPPAQEGTPLGPTDVAFSADGRRLATKWLPDGNRPRIAPSNGGMLVVADVLRGE